MSTTATTGFASAYLDTTDCEIHADETGEAIAYIPTRATAVATLKLKTKSFTQAELTAREAGLEPKWGV